MMNIKTLALNNWKLLRCHLALENNRNWSHCSQGPCAASFQVHLEERALHTGLPGTASLCRPPEGESASTEKPGGGTNHVCSAIAMLCRGENPHDAPGHLSRGTPEGRCNRC